MLVKDLGGGANLTMGIRNFNLQRSQVIRKGCSGLNPVLNIYPFPPLLPCFLFALSNKKRKLR